MFQLRSTVAAAALTALLAAGSGPALARADEAGPLLAIQAASVGFGGKFKAGFWQPVRLTLAARSQAVRGRLELVVPDGDQVPVVYGNEQAGEFSLAAGEKAEVLLYAKTGPIAAPIRVQLRSDGRVVWSQNLSPLVGPALVATQELTVGLGPPIGLEEAVAAIRRQPALALAVAQVSQPAELPDQWWAYEGVDTVVLPTSDATFLDALSQPQRKALLDWVLLGGRMVLCVGARGEQIAAAGSPWAALLPGTFSEVAPLSERSGLETFTKVELPFDREDFQRNRPRITRLSEVRGEVVVGELTGTTRPLAVRSTAGLGEVVFVGLDLDHPSLALWPGRTRLVSALVPKGHGRHESSEREAHRGVARLGYDDLSGQLRMALDQFPGVSLVNFTTVSVLTIVYLLLIGPGDFLFLSRLGLPRHATWITFPLVALAGTGLAWALAGQTHGSRVRLNHAEVIDLDAERQLIRGTAWAQLYSPATTRYDVRLHFAPPAGTMEPPRGWLSWQGLTGDSLGGLASGQVALSQPEPYRAAMPGDAPRLDGLPLAIASSKSLSARWWARATLPANSRLTVNQDGLLFGEFQQPLPVELTDCLLAQGEKLYRLGRLRPGETVTIDPQASLNLEWRLTLRRIEESKDVATPWDQTMTDVPRIVQMLMFHEAARGQTYTGLMHRYQPYVDLSEHIRLGQAVLVGRAAQPITNLQSGDEPLAYPSDTTTWTWYRIVFPVQRLTTAN
jgi:hypothetical protein